MNLDDPNYWQQANQEEIDKHTMYCVNCKKTIGIGYHVAADHELTFHNGAQTCWTKEDLEQELG